MINVKEENEEIIILEEDYEEFNLENNDVSCKDVFQQSERFKNMGLMSIFNGTNDAQLDNYKKQLRRVCDTLRITTVEQLFKIPKDEMQRLTKLNRNETANLLKEISSRISINNCIGPLIPQTAFQLKQYNHSQVYRLSIGDEIFDQFVNGGIRPGEITEIYGEAGSGKTQISIQLLFQVQLSLEDGGLDGDALYIYTEDYPQSRIEHFVAAYASEYPHIFYDRKQKQQQQQQQQSKNNKKKSKDGDLSSTTTDSDKTTTNQPRDPLDHIILQSCKTTHELSNIIRSRIPDALSSSSTGSKLKLIIIDSIAALLRPEFAASQSIQRSQFLFSLSSDLKKLAHMFNLVVVVINQVSEYISSDHFESGQIPSLGLSWSTCVNTRLGIRKLKKQVRVGKKRKRRSEEEEEGEPEEEGEVSNVRRIKVVLSSHVKPMSCDFVITSRGVVGLESMNENTD